MNTNPLPLPRPGRLFRLQGRDLKRTRCYGRTLKAIAETTKTASDQNAIIIPAVPAPPLRPKEAQSRLARPFPSSESVSKAERPGLRFFGPRD